MLSTSGVVGKATTAAPLLIVQEHAGCVGLMGFGNGRAGRRFSLLDSVYGAVLAVALWMTIDLDYPGIGIIRLSNLSVVHGPTQAPFQPPCRPRRRSVPYVAARHLADIASH